MNAWRRLALVYLGLLFLSMVTTRFQVVAPLSITSGVLPLTQLFAGGAGNIRKAYMTYAEERDLAARNRELRDQNEMLRGTNDRLERENVRLRQAAQIRTTQSPSLVTVASVVKVDPSPLLSRLTVNRGVWHGVRRFMPATAPAGLIGQVTEVDGNSAVVTTIVDPESRVGITLKKKGGRGTAYGAPPDRLRGTFPLTVDVKPGDIVLTSSLGGVYPVGIQVGKVEQVVELGPNEVHRTVIITPSVDVSIIEEIALLEAIP